MGKFNLNTSTDFARLTLSNATDILSDFLGGGKDWDIAEGSFNGVKFHIFKDSSDFQGAVHSVVDSGGRRKVKYKFPYKDGQAMDDLGQTPETFELDILIFGPKYLSALNSLMKELNQPKHGVLVHPIRGDVQCAMESYQVTHSSDSRKAAALKLTMSEHTFEINELKDLSSFSLKDALAKALEIFKIVERVLNRINGAALFVASLRAKIARLLNQYQSDAAKNLGNINVTFNRGSARDIPALLPVNRGGTLNPDGTASQNTFPLAGVLSDPFLNVPLDDLDATAITALATSQVIKDTNKLRGDLDAIIEEMKAGADGEGALEFYEEILELKEAAILMQDALEKGIASSQARIINYVTPRVMTLREVAFANGVDVDRVGELDILNPDLLSTNFIASGTALKVPKS